MLAIERTTSLRRDWRYRSLGPAQSFHKFLYIHGIWKKPRPMIQESAIQYVVIYSSSHSSSPRSRTELKRYKVCGHTVWIV
jgi:hypothetical protein